MYYFYGGSPKIHGLYGKSMKILWKNWRIGVITTFWRKDTPQMSRLVLTCSPQPGRCSTLAIIIITITIIIIITASSHHHSMIIVALKFATPSEQYVDWGNHINFIFMRGQSLPPPLNNMLIGVITSSISP